MVPFIYLVQGQAERIRTYLPLADRPRADALFLTYDQPLDGATFFPNSTWSEGRNQLLEMAQAVGPYEYYIFCDDDVEFDQGGWTELEERLLKHRPAIGVPVMPKTHATPIPGLRHQPFTTNDEQVLCLHRDVIEDNLLMPYQSQFDSVHWWAACQIQKILIQTFYRDGAIQFNDIRVRNECRVRYDDPEEGRARFEALVRNWLTTQLIGGFRDFSFFTGRFRWRTWRTVLLHKARTMLRDPARSHHLPPDVAEQILAPGAELRAQYRGGELVASVGASGESLPTPIARFPIPTPRGTD